MKHLFILILISVCGFSQSYKEQVETKLRETYGDSITISYKKVKLPKEVRNPIEQSVRQRFFRPELYSWKITIAGETKYVVLDNVIGKVQPMTFMVVFNQYFSVDYIELLKYRESHGYEVGYRSFLNQFQGKTEKSDLVVGKDIDGISGATISVHSMNRGVKKLSKIIPYISEQF